MENKELKIVPPEGYEIDREKSTFECIKFKKKPNRWNRWRDNPDAIISGYCIISGIVSSTSEAYNISFSHDVFATKKQAKSALAMAQISQIMANDKRFGGPVTDVEWRDDDLIKYIIIRKAKENHCKESNKVYYDRIVTDIRYFEYHFLAFHTKEQRDLFLAENRDLVKDYFMID